MHPDKPAAPQAVDDSRPAANAEMPVLEEVDLFVPEPAWTLSDPQAIEAELRRLMAAETACLLRPEDGSDLIARLLAIDTASGRIEWQVSGPNDAVAALPAAARVAVSATIGLVDLMFEVSRFAFSGNMPPTLRSTLPQQVRRVQRREAYRLRMRAYSRGGPSALFRLGTSQSPARVRILDLSVGGCGLLLPAGVSPETLPVGTMLRSVRVELTTDLVFMAAAQVVWRTAVREKDTLVSRVRVGCAWQAMPHASERLIQRHLDEVQRQRRMLMKG